MPRPNSLLNKREREICERVHLIRIGIIKWSQPNLARELGLTHNQLAGLEYARAPLRYRVGNILCDRFNINQRWLATGALPQRHYVDIDPYFEAQIQPSMLFSEAYDNLLAKLVGPQLEVLAQKLFCAVEDIDKSTRRIGVSWPAGSPVAMTARIYHDRLIDWRVRKLPESKQVEIFKRLNAVLDELLPGMQPGHALSSKPHPRKSKSKELLDNQFGMMDKEGVKAKIRSLPDLINQLRELTKSRGQKAALARELKVSRQAVDQWLSGNSNPSAKTTLELLNWVEQQ